MFYMSYQVSFLYFIICRNDVKIPVLSLLRKDAELLLHLGGLLSVNDIGKTKEEKLIKINLNGIWASSIIGTSDSYYQKY